MEKLIIKCNEDVSKEIKKICSKYNIEFKTIEVKKMGRKPIQFPPNWEAIYKMYKRKDITGNRAMEMLNLKRTSFYKLIKIYNGYM